MDVALSQFVVLLHAVIDKVAPFKEMKVKQKSEPWVNTDILAGIRRRNALFRSFRKDTNKKELYVEYCRVRNRVQRDIKKAKESYFRDQIERNKNNSS